MQSSWVLLKRWVGERRGKMWSQRKTQGLSPGRLAVTPLILRITGSPCGWWANPSGSWWGRGHLHSSGSWVSADRHSSGSGVDCASEMLFIWLTAEFICSVTYLISLIQKKKSILFCHVLFGFYFDSSDFYTIWQGVVSAWRNICQQEWHKWYFFQNHDVWLMWHMFLLGKTTSKPFRCQWDAEMKCLKCFRPCLGNLLKNCG